MKKRLSILLVGLLIFAVGIAEAAYADGYFRYDITQNTITIQGYSGEDSTVWVPESIAGRKVVKIASGAFSRNDAVTQIRLPVTVVTIEAGAFRQGQAVSYYVSVKVPEVSTDTTSSAVQEPQESDTPVQNPQESDTPEQESEKKEPEAAEKETGITEKKETGTTEKKSESSGKTEQKTKPESSGKTEQKTPSAEQTTEEEVPAKPEGMETGVAEEAVEEEPQQVWYGIWTERYHSTVSVDSAGRLVIVDEDGRVTRVDDSRTYTLYNAGDGFQIQDDQGEWVTVDDEGYVIVPARGGRVDMNRLSNYLIIGAALVALSGGTGFFLWRRKR